MFCFFFGLRIYKNLFVNILVPFLFCVLLFVFVCECVLSFSLSLSSLVLEGGEKRNEGKERRLDGR